MRLFAHLSAKNSAVRFRAGKFGIVSYIEAEAARLEGGPKKPTFLNDARLGSVGAGQTAALRGFERAAVAMHYRFTPSSVDLPFLA